MHVGAVSQVIAAALVVERRILRLCGMDGIGTVLRVRVKLQLAWQGRATEYHLLAAWWASVGDALGTACAV